MWKEMAQVGISSVPVIDSDKVLRAQHQALTVGNSCTGLPSTDVPPFTKVDFERDLRKVTRKIKR
jgi:hypothetical protein